jgi:hypothetical protein
MQRRISRLICTRFYTRFAPDLHLMERSGEAANRADITPAVGRRLLTAALIRPPGLAAEAGPAAHARSEWIRARHMAFTATLRLICTRFTPALKDRRSWRPPGCLARSARPRASARKHWQHKPGVQHCGVRDDCEGARPLPIADLAAAKGDQRPACGRTGG